MTPQLAAKRALIVGGTSGIGLACAARFLEEGARVAIAGHVAEQGRNAELQLRDLGHVRFALGDVTKSAAVEALFQESVDFLGGLDILVHTAGGSGRSAGDASLHLCSDQGWDDTLRLNLTSVFWTNREAIRWFLQARNPGAILNTASVLAFAPAPQHFDTCAYTAAKGGIVSLSRLAAARYAADGIRVNVLAPGLIDTPMSRRAMQDEAIQQFLKTKQPLFGGAGTAADCAAAAAFLCSDEARGITGLVMPVDGGWSVL
jgi:NAD(P)-dependent dehydrogenase (short-subunit alcohol dehydrogenase family)